jgi:hypothetical protein
MIGVKVSDQDQGNYLLPIAKNHTRNNIHKSISPKQIYKSKSNMTIQHELNDQSYHYPSVNL